MTPLRHTVPRGSSPERIDRYLTQLLPRSSRAQIQRWIADGCVLVHGEKIKASHRVAPGEELLVTVPPPRSFPLKAEPIPLSILYEDEQILVVDKPAGMVTHPAPGHPEGTLVNALLARSPCLSSVAGPFKPGIVHRLDKDTSGLLVVAKDDETHRDLSRQFAAREVKRVYLAVVQGRVRQEEGTIEAPIGRHPVKRQKMAVQYGAGREALTRYRVVRRFREATLLRLYPQTGRTHQLRVHLKHLGHPILGDTRYGVRGGPLRGLRAGFPRQALHAHQLGFRHPAKGNEMEFTSWLPADLEACLRGMENPQEGS